MSKKFRSIALLTLCVMIFPAVQSCFAEYRTGSATGDAVVYGVGGALVAAGAAAVTIVATLGTGGLAAGPLCAAGGVGGVIGGTYGALDDNKTLAKDLIAAGAVTLAGAMVGGIHTASATVKEVGRLGEVTARQGNKINTIEGILDSMDPYDYIGWTY